ncbi:MAG: hypothetical protein KDA56_00345 [Hyphomonas sp.]|nr:hypothetical protein [Hyphomonas sp.]
MRPGQAILTSAAIILLAACGGPDGPLVPPLGTKVPPVPAEGLEHPGRTRVKRVSTACTMPRPSGDAEILGIIVSHGNALSNIAVAGQDEETTAALIHVDPGDTPVYLIALSGQPMLWVVEGATERVERLIVQPAPTKTGPGVAVTGLTASRVGALNANACGQPYELVHYGAEDLFQKLRSTFRRDDLRMVGVESVGTVRAPSGKLGGVRSSRNGPMITTDAGNYVIRDSKPVRVNPNARNFTVNQFRSFYPGGVVMVHPETVVSTRPVDVYDVLPAEAGLIQLVETGALTFVPEEAGYLINGPIPRIPAGLNGAHSVKFGLAEGVEKPKGTFNHSSLFDAATGECLEGQCKWLEEISRRDDEYRRQLRRRR